MRRHELTDEHWDAIKELLAGKEGDPGVTAKDNRLFVNAILFVAKRGIPWRDLPECFGPWPISSSWRSGTPCPRCPCSSTCTPTSRCRWKRPAKRPIEGCR